MKKKTFALLTALTLLLLTACGSGGGKDSAAAAGQNSDAASEPMEAPIPAPDGGWDESYAMSQETGGMPENTKVILSGELELETKEFDAAVQAVDELVAELGGWYESRSVNQGSRYRSVYATIRVPARNFNALLERAGEAAHKVSSNGRQQDVSEVYYDSEARLATQRTKLERLQNLLAQAESMEDIIALESAISETELQIEYLTGSLRKYDSLVNYSTVELTLREVYRLSTDQEVPLTYGERLGDAFATGLQRGVDNLEDFTISLARNWLTLLLWVLWAAFAAGIILLIRRRERKRRRSAPPPPFPGRQAQPEAKSNEEDSQK